MGAAFTAPWIASGRWAGGLFGAAGDDGLGRTADLPTCCCADRLVTQTTNRRIPIGTTQTRDGARMVKQNILIEWRESSWKGLCIHTFPKDRPQNLAEPWKHD